MYKIMTKLHTKAESVYRYYMIRNGQGKLVDFETEDRDEAAEVALELLRRVGYLDLRVVDEQPYYIEVEKTDDPGVLDEDIENAEKLLGIVGYDDLYLNHDAKYDVVWNWGIKPHPIEETYTLIFINDLQGSWDYPEAGEIKAGESRTNHLTIEGEYESFHLIVDGYDCRQGMPEWIEYLGDFTFSFNDIQADHEIEVVVDGSPEPPTDTYTLTFVDDEGGHWELPIIDNINPGEDKTNSLILDSEYDSYNLIVDGVPCGKTLPEWITQDGLIYTFHNINVDHTIEVTVIRPVPPTPGELIVIEEGGTYNIEYKNDAVLPDNIVEILRTVDRVDQFTLDEKTGQDFVTRLGVCWIEKPLIGYMKEWAASYELHHIYYTMINEELLAEFNRDTHTPLEYTHDGWIYADYITNRMTEETTLNEIRYLDSIEPLTIRADMVKTQGGAAYDLNNFAWLVSNSQRIDN